MKPTRPASVLVIAILHFIFGGFGLLCGAISTAQNLAALAMNLSLVGRAAGGLDPKTRQRLADSHRLAVQSCRELRTLSYLLHPPELEEGDVWSAVRWYAEGFSARSGIP